MTVSAGSTKTTQVCNGSLTDFDFSFAIYKEEDIAVILKHIATEVETVLVLNTDYTVASDDFADGGTVSTIKEIDEEMVPYAWSADYSITIMLNLALVQETDLLYGGNFSSEAIELAADRLTRIAQQLDERINRTIKLRKTSALDNIEIDDLEAGKFVIVNAAGDALEMGTTSGSGEASVSNDPYNKDTWNGVVTVAASKNAIRDELFNNRFTKGKTYGMIIALGSDGESYPGLLISNEVYGAGWNGDITMAASRNALYDKIESIGAGSGDVIGPATNTIDYVPQWLSNDSKTLKNGFPITAAGKALIDDANAVAQRTTLGLGSAALRTAEDVLTDGSNLPDGHAIKVYGNANWGGGAGDVIGPASATDNAIPLFDGTTGKLIQNSLITVDAAGAPTFPNDTALRWKQVGGAVKNVLAYDLLDNIVIGVDGDDAHIFIERLDTSSAGAPLQSSRMFKIAANYWKAAAEHQRMGMVWHEMLNDNPMSRLHFEVGEENAETKVMSLENDNGTLLAIFQGSVKIEGGSPGINKVLTSDANGKATWDAPTGGGDVSGPATNTDDYVPQWNGANSKLLKDGFAITAAGKALVDDANVAAQRTTLGLGSAALRTAEDTLSDGSNLPDGHAIKVYGDTNWGGGGGSGDVTGPATHPANYVPQWNSTPNSKTLVSGFLITTLGKNLLDDTTTAAMRSTLGLSSAALRNAEDTLTDGSNLPDGHAIKVYGDANWGDGGGSGFWTDHTTHISPTNTRDVALTGSERFKMAGGVYPLEYGGPDFRVMTPGSTAIPAQKYGFNRKALWSFFATDTDNPDEMIIEMDIIQRSGAGQRAKTGIKINHYSQPDNGGDVSGILALQTGGGGAITCYKTHMMRPSGYTDYSSSQQGALEVGSGDDSQAGLFMSGINIGGSHTHASECIWCRIDNAQSKGILVTPGDGNFNGRQAFAVGDIYRNASQDGNKTFEVKCDGDVYMQDLFMSNTKAISFKNSSGTYKNMITMQSDNTLRIGWELGANKIMMNIDGSLKTLSIDGSGFVKAS